MTAADAAELRTLPRLARTAAMAQAAQAAQVTPAGQRRFARTASNLSPAVTLDRAEEDQQRMVGGALAVTEATLIARAQAGDHAAFESIFTQYQTQIYNYIYRLMGSAEDAYDMTQDTFLKAYLALPKTSDDLRVGAWLYRIATNVCLDELRHRRLVKWQPWEAFISVFHPTQVAKDSPERDTIDRENTEEVQLILDKLHPKYRMCLILREYHDLSYDEIADVLNTTRAAVKSLLFRAREEFRQVYAKVERKPGHAAA
jgi:RNA polymerase sigma-70 factor (ECF subfamily)